jgi:hypothetical protein
MRTFGEEGFKLKLVRDLDGQLRASSADGDGRETSWLIQRISLPPYSAWERCQYFIDNSAERIKTYDRIPYFMT